MISYKLQSIYLCSNVYDVNNTKTSTAAQTHITRNETDKKKINSLFSLPYLQNIFDHILN